MFFLRSKYREKKEYRKKRRIILYEKEEIMGDVKFKEGDVVYHKATFKRGVIAGKSEEGWIIVWKDSTKEFNEECELWSEEEWEKRRVNPKAI